METRYGRVIVGKRTMLRGSMTSAQGDNPTGIFDKMMLIWMMMMMIW